MCRRFDRHEIILVLIFASGLLFPSTLLAQSPGFYGQVTNNLGEPIPGAAIHLTQASGKGKELTVKADKQGVWIYINVPNVPFKIIARAPGHQPSSRSNVTPSVEGTRVDIAMVPGDPSAQVAESNAVARQKVVVDPKKAKALQQGANEANAALLAGLDLMKQAKYQDAIAQFTLALEKAANSPPRILAALLANLADAQWKAGQKAQALENYDKAIAAEPNDSTLWVNKGTVLNDLGKTAEAQECFKKAMEINPAQKGEAFFNIGVLLLNAGQSKEAATAFRQSIEADRTYAESYFQLARCLLGDNATMSEAAKFLEQYIRIGKDPQNLQTAKEILDTIKK